MTERQRAETMTWAMSIIREAVASGYYGTITLHMRAGQVGRVVREESILPPAPGVFVREGLDKAK